MFKDLKVIELASVLAGPAVGMFFSELGAEVIKVENKRTGGDMTRRWKLPEESPESSISAYFSSVNYKKQYLFKDFSNKEDIAEVHELIKTADIVISNFKEGSAEKFSMDYESIRQLNTKIIYAKIEGFTSDPQKVAFDIVLQAETGFMGMNGYTENDPAKLPVALIDIIAAHQLKEGILIALLKREKDKEGSLVSVSLEEAALSSLANQASNFLMQGKVAERIGSLHPNIAPYGEIFTTKDKVQVVLAVGTDHQFFQLCEVLKCKAVFENAKFKTNTQRVIYRQELKDILSNYFENWKSVELLTEFKQRKIPIGEIKNLKQVMNNPLAKQMVLSEIIEGIKTQRLRTVAFKIS